MYPGNVPSPFLPSWSTSRNMNELEGRFFFFYLTCTILFWLNTILSSVACKVQSFFQVINEILNCIRDHYDCFMDCKPTNEVLLMGLKEKIATGDQNSFRQLFHLYAKRLTQFAYAIVKWNDAAREIVDEVFIKIWKNKTSITSIQNLTVYLYKAIKNTSLNYLSARAKESIIESFDFFSCCRWNKSERNWIPGPPLRLHLLKY